MEASNNQKLWKGRAAVKGRTERSKGEEGQLERGPEEEFQIVYFEKIRVFKAVGNRLEYISMG